MLRAGNASGNRRRRPDGLQSSRVGSAENLRPPGCSGRRGRMACRVVRVGSAGSLRPPECSGRRIRGCADGGRGAREYESGRMIMEGE